MVNHCDTGLLALPKELLIKIRSNLHCLKDHVNFSLVCSSTFRLYSRQYWKFACISAGWGIRNLSPRRANKIKHKSKAYRRHRTWPWGGLARIVVIDAPFFRALYMFALEDLDESPAIYESTRHDTAQWKARTVEDMGRTFERMIWTDTALISPVKPPVVRPWLMDGLMNANDEEFVEDLTNHPYISNRLISQYPISKLVVDDGAGDLLYLRSSSFYIGDGPHEYTLHNKHGVTVADVYLSFGEHMSTTENQGFCNLLEHYNMALVHFTVCRKSISAKWER